MKLFYLITERKILLSLVVALVVYHVTFGLATLDPTNIKWLMSVYHDWGTHYLGWAFYRDAPWTFPLGRMDNYYYPIGTNVGFTDSIPLMAFIFKLLSGILPEDFQYFGIWLLVCYFLNSFYTIKILNIYKTHPAIIIIAVVMVTANPVLVFRGMHPSLCAHWLLLASLYHYLLPAKQANVIKINKLQLVIFLLSATINPYLAMMVAGFNFIIPFRHFFYDKVLSLKKALLFPLVSFCGGLAFWIVFGIIEFSGGTNLDVGNIYGMYAFNLNSFFNSYGYYSHFLPDLGKVTDFQHEGFGYLGIGMIFLALLAIVITIVNIFTKRGLLRKYRNLIPLFGLCLFTILFAVSNAVSWGTEVLFTYPTFGFVEKLGNIFRAIGRFGWILYYVILIFSILIFSKLRINNYFKISFFTLLAGLQLYDIENLLTARHLQNGVYHTKLDDRQWSNVFKKFDAIITYPPYTNNWVYPMDYQDLAFLALKTGKPISNGYAARENLLQIQAYNDTLVQQLSRGNMGGNNLFVTTAKNLQVFQGVFRKGKAEMKKMGEFIFLYPKDKDISGLFQQSTADIKYVDSLKQAFTSNQEVKQITQKWATTANVRQFVEKYSFQEDVLQIKGWAFNTMVSDNRQDTIYISLTNSGKSYLFPTTRIVRSDISTTFKKQLDASGFETIIFADELPKQAYEVGIVIKDKSGKYQYANTNQVAAVGKKEFKKPIRIKQLPQTTDMLGNIENVLNEKDYIQINGWAALKDRTSENTIISVAILSGGGNYMLETDLVMRSDVTSSVNGKQNYDFSGFTVKFKKKNLPDGNYKLGIIIIDKNTKKSYFKDFDKRLLQTK